MNTKVGKWISIGRLIIRAPLKFLSRARDLYVKSFNDCATNVPVDHFVTAGFLGFPTSASSEFSRYVSQINSFNSSESNKSDDFRDLIRVASSQSNFVIRRTARSSAAVPRMNTNKVAVYGRIDENEPYDDDLSAEDIQLIPGHVFPRSRSHANTTRRAFRSFYPNN